MRADSSGERFYVGRRADAPAVYVVTREQVEPLAHVHHGSSAPFDWGTIAPGALELAAALLSDVSGRRPPHFACLEFCSEVVRCLLPGGFILSADDVDALLEVSFLTPEMWASFGSRD